MLLCLRETILVVPNKLYKFISHISTCENIKIVKLNVVIGVQNLTPPFIREFSEIIMILFI